MKKWIRAGLLLPGSLLATVTFLGVARAAAPIKSSDEKRETQPPTRPAPPRAPRTDISVTVQIAPAVAIPKEHYLSQNNPNPFSSTTDVSFGCPEAGRVSVRIYDTAGREVVTLHDAHMEAGNHVVQWDCRDRSGRRVASGFYFCRMNAKGYSKTRKMLLLH